jgi:hypothetical protein
LLREVSVDRAVDSFPDAASIYEANIATLRTLGDAGWQSLREACERDATATARTAPRPPTT